MSTARPSAADISAMATMARPRCRRKMAIGRTNRVRHGRHSLPATAGGARRGAIGYARAMRLALHSGVARALTPLALAALLAGACKTQPRETDTAPPRTPVASGGGQSATEAPAAEAKAPAPAASATDVATGKRGAVTSAEKHATAIGKAVLEKGGNAVDAAVAVGFALGGDPSDRRQHRRRRLHDHPVSRRQVNRARLPREAPGKASRDMYLTRTASRRWTASGPRAAGIPGNVAGSPWRTRSTARCRGRTWSSRRSRWPATGTRSIATTPRR